MLKADRLGYVALNVLDLKRSTEFFTKAVHLEVSDFRDGKVTLPVILAQARGTAADQAFWRDAIEGRRISDQDLAEATALLHQTGAIDDTLARARLYGRRALDALAGFPRGVAREALAEAVEFAIARAY